MPRASDTITVLESARAPTARTNPYLPLLVASFRPPVQARWFSWPGALFGSFDVFHLHWPEVRLLGRDRVRTLARSALFLLLLLRIRAQRKGLVRTLHNAVPHDELATGPAALVRLCDRWTTAWITMSDLISAPSSAGDVTVIPHGHYRGWFAHQPRSEPVPGRIVHMGLVRRYKGVDSLLRAFASIPDRDTSLRIVGATRDAALAAEIQDACARDRRITAVDEYVPDDRLVREVTAGELVVLPFATVTNSGSLLLALSLDRPVLVPSQPMTEQLAAEVGPGWVFTYAGSLDPAALLDTLLAARRSGGGDRPNLSAREWDAIGVAHAVVFQRAARAARRRPRGSQRL